MIDLIVMINRGRGHEDYFALFDGHGGKDAAEFAATHLHEILAEKLKTNNPVKSLKEAFVDTHKLISDQVFIIIISIIKLLHYYCYCYDADG